MKPFEPNIQTLSLARDVLLTPFGLDESRLIHVLGTMFTHKVDYADLYFQFTKSEGWSLEEGIVKTGSFSIDQGVGVRAISGERTAFSYSDDISEPALLEAAAATRTIARQGAGRVKVAARVQPSGGRSLYLPHDPLSSLDATEKVKLLERVERIARAKDPRVVQVMAGLAGEYDVVLVVRSDGVLAAAQGGRHPNGRRTWGHSMLVDPWGEVKAVLPEGEGVVCGDFDAGALDTVRANLPALNHRVL
jgi:TldD protein